MASRWTRIRPMLPMAAALLITLYGGLLRLDAFTGRYGTLARPAWARFMTQTVAPLARAIRPAQVTWGREAQPYVGGDPINYLAYGRAMRTFYQPHVREPVFLALTRASLWALDGQDAGVSLASAAGSTLAILATYLLGAALISPLGGLGAALVLAIEYEAILWAPEGWRDDTFMAAVLFAAWAFVRMRNQPSFGNALLLGFTAGAACLTRITALSFILPGLAWLIVDGSRSGIGVRARHAATALLILAAVVAPYLISCAIATGDPLLAINYHTLYYRSAEGLPFKEPMSAAAYIRSKFALHPVGTFDTGAVGLIVQPFITKWNGLGYWVPGLGAALKWLAVAGLAAMPFSPNGRLILVVLITSLLPYAFTWNIGGGSEWRFTMHAYPLYIVAAMYALAGGCRAVAAVRRDRSRLRRTAVVPVIVRAGVAAAVMILAAAGYYVLPWLVVREAIASGDSTSVETGTRDDVFYRDGWSKPHDEGIIVRVSRGERATVRLPLPEKRPYDIVLRIDPVVHQAPGRVAVLLNHRLVGRVQLTWNPERVGSYRITAPAEAVKRGSNELAIVPETVVPAGQAGPQFAWLQPDAMIGVRLWYVRVLP